MLLLCALLLSGLQLGMSKFTYSLRCYECATINTFECSNLMTCDYEIRRCLTVSIRLNSREVLVYKNCTNNCTFVYESEMPPPAPKALRTNSFYWVRCCGLMSCNVGGPTNLERDILPDQTIEEELEGGVCLGGGGLWGALLSCASVLLSSALT
ncbi:glycosyl-phosphatidylinositol-anchored molecule-like protein [Myotis daubentonii]|uniref:glycosyl-phosphatidylinositol-anchored molecule-like protein n=1 Tax=Myotis daubentonii TaxID=98922 RepID=UPI002873BD74|nr:glycosyl-phosphatidylinositol-anchored molecule-like protein [Myotis daubentonii]